LSAQQFPELFEQISIHTEQLQLWRMPEIYFQNDVKRPHVMGLFQKYLFVLPTSYLELTEVRRFQLLLELARIKRTHQEKQFLLWIGSRVPFLRPAYTRACERTRYQMVLPLGSNEFTRQAIFEDILGPTLLPTTDIVSYTAEKYQQRTFSALLYEKPQTNLSMVERLRLTGEPLNQPRPFLRYSQGIVIALSVLTVLFFVSAGAGILLNEEGTQTAASNNTVTAKTNDQDLSETVLMAAIQKGKLEEIHRLIPESDMKAVDANGDTSLHYLGYRNSSKGLESIFKELLEAGSDVDAVNDFGDLGKILRFFVMPLIALVVFNALFTFYHMPFIFDYVLTNYTVHRLFHGTLIFLSMTMWYPIIAPVNENDSLSDLKNMVYIVANGVLLTPACAFMIFSQSFQYQADQDPATFAKVLAYCMPNNDLSGLNLERLLGTTDDLLEDQRFGGVLMKLGQELVYGLFFGLTFFTWVRRSKSTAVDEGKSFTRKAD
jgi:hypothetical protein